MDLKQYLKAHGIRLNFFASKIGVTASTVHGIVTGLREPKLSLALAIEDATNGLVTCRDLKVDKEEPQKNKDLGKKQRGRPRMHKDLALPKADQAISLN